MYKSFRIKNFRCFRDLQIEDLGRVNLIAGRNNTGKTALLEAMYLHTRSRQPKTLLELQKQIRGLDEPDQDLPTYWRHYFYNLDASLAIEIHAENAEEYLILYIFEPNLKENAHQLKQDYVNHLTNYQTPQPEAIRLANEIDAAIVMKYSYDTVSPLSSALYSDGNILNSADTGMRSLFIPAQGRPEKDSALDKFGSVVKNGGLTKLIAALKALDPRLSDLRGILTYGELMLWAQTGSEYIPLKLMGEGFNRALHFMVTMMTEPNSYLFIDEIENGIHHSAQKCVWHTLGKLAREHNIQVFATTHSLEMIEAAHEAFKDDDPYEFRYHRLDRYEDSDEIEAVTYNDLDMQAVAAFNFHHEVRG